MELDASGFDDFVAKNPRLVVMFYRSTCSHSMKMDPIYVQLCSEMKGLIGFCKVSTPANMELVRRFTIKSTPTFVFYIGGKEMGRAVGERTKEALKAEIERCINVG